MLILAIDPGPERSGIVRYDPERSTLRPEIMENPDLLRWLRLKPAGYESCVVAIEMIASYGMPVGKEVFATCVWIGRFVEACPEPDAVRLIPRLAVKLHLCRSARAKDANIWRALLDRFGPVGTKAAPGKLYGVRSHARAALALAVTVADGAA